MSQQWGAGQPGYQYPLQTGFPGAGGQFQPGFGGGLAPQPTGYPGQRPGFQQPQPTGYPGPQGFQQPQQTGFQPGYQQQQQQPPPVPPLPSNLGTGFRQNFQGSFLGVQQQQQPQPQLPPQNSFLSRSPALAPQPTGFPGGGALVPQPTGFVDPRLQLLSSTFLPANLSAPFAAGGLPQFAGGPPGGAGLQQSIQQYNQQLRGTAAPKMAWALTKAEKKNYDQIFRAWDPQSSGFISGQMALEVFGQSGLDKNDLAKIWALADADNRGKLNLAEFHVAMGLIYRKLNGNEVPDELPPELVPPSSRDLDTSVAFLRDILKNDTSRAAATGSPVSRGKVRSFNDTGPAGGGGRKDATVYKHADDSDTGGYYQSRARHVDRRAVRVGTESPAEDLSDVRRQLEDTAKRLDDATAASSARTAEDEALDREMEDLRYRVRRVQEDLEYVSRGPRSTTKDDERRRLERDLLHLLHERVPEVERKIQERERRKEREKREWNRDRDRRNERFGRYDDGYDRDRDRGGSRYDSKDHEDDRDRGYSRGSSERDDRDRDRDRDRDYDRDRPSERDRAFGRDRSRDRDRDYDRRRSPPPSVRSPPPPPPPEAPPSKISNPPPAPAPPKPTASPAPNLSSMTPEQRKAYIREQAQRRLQERKQVLGVVTSSSPTIDTSVEDRLAQEKKEAEEKARQGEKAAEERERIRKERLEGEKADRGGKSPAPTPAPTGIKAPAPPAPTPRAAAPTLPAPKRAPAPPPPRRGAAPRAAATPAAPPAPPPQIRAPAPPLALVVPEEDPEEKRLREREEEIRKQREARAERLRLLEKEEEDARRAEEEYQARRKAFLNSHAEPTSPAPPPPPPAAPTAAAAESAPAAPPPPPPPPPPAPPTPALAGSPSADKPSNNPFSRLVGQGGTPATATPSASTPTANGGTNPFFRPNQTPTSATSPSAVSPLPPKSPAPAANSTYQTVPGDSDDGEWDNISEKDQDDSSEDELSSSRDTRNKLAQQLFGSIIPARPQSAAGSGLSQPATPAPPPPPPAPAAPAPPPAPAAPPPPAAAAAPSGPADRGALLNAIASGARLRKAVTNDRSTAAVAGQVLGDTAPPVHINAAPRPASPPVPISAPPPLAPVAPVTRDEDPNASYRQSVDWYAGLAVDQGAVHHLSPTIEEQEEESPTAIVPQIRVQEAVVEAPDPLEDVDKSVEHRVRTLYPYTGQRPEDLSFAENLVVKAHPSKSGGDWWYGTLSKDGKSGFFPSTYVEVLENVKAKALYSYTGGNADELPFAEGDILAIVDRKEADWWKTEQGGVIFIVPAAYLELVEVGSELSATDRKAPTAATEQTAREPTEAPTSPLPVSAPDDDATSDDESSSEEYLSFDSDTESVTSTEGEGEDDHKEDHEARAKERLRVLEAAGLIVKAASRTPPPRPVRTRSLRRRRPPPAAPRRHSAASGAPEKDLPPAPEPEPEPEPAPAREPEPLHVDDAFERYEAFRQAKDHRLSLASLEPPPSPGPGAGAGPASPASLAPSASRESDRERPHSALFHFLGRRTPGVEPEKPRLQISGPILSVPSAQTSESPSRENSPAFGSSWASLVDKDALEGIPTSERRRQEVIFELINTEAAYVRDLQLIVEVFFSNIIPLLDSKETTVIFANVEDLLLTNTTFLSSLEERQKDCRLYIDNIGDLLAKHMSHMGVYMQYCVNHGTAIKILQSLREAKPELASQLQRLRDDPAVRSLDLSSYLLAPMQRITRYPLLLRQILNHTQVEQDRKQIESALANVEGVLNHINESIREQEGRARLKAVSQDLWIGQGLLDLTAPTRYLGPRVLLKEGNLAKAKKGRSGRRLRAFLCNDILVLTDEAARAMYRLPISLSEVEVSDVPGSRDDLAFRLALPYPRGGTMIDLRAASARECDLWMKAIQSAGRRCREVEKRVARRARASG